MEAVGVQGFRHEDGLGHEQAAQSKIPVMALLQVPEVADTLVDSTAEKEIARRQRALASKEGVADRREEFDALLDGIKVVDFSRREIAAAQDEIDLRKSKLPSSFETRGDEPRKAPPREQVIRIQNVDETATGFANTAVDRLVCPGVLLILEEDRPPKARFDVRPIQIVSNHSRRTVRGPVVDENELNWLVILVIDRLKLLFDILLVMESRNDDGDKREVESHDGNSSIREPGLKNARSTSHPCHGPDLQRWPRACTSPGARRQC